jgi:hypothetical protein
MARTPAKGSRSKSTEVKRKAAKASGRRAGPRKASSGRRKADKDSFASDAGDAVIKLLQSPLVADLVAVAATAALAALAEQRFSAASSRKKAAGQAVKAAGVAAAAAIGRRLSEEFAEIKKASKPAARA